MRERGVHGAFGESSSVCDHAQTGADASPFVSRRFAVKMQVNQVSGWLLIVADQIAHQHIEHVIVDRNGLFETWHSGRMK